MKVSRQLEKFTRVIAVLDLLDSTDCEIVSWGLAPNPNGFCFERGENTTTTQARALSEALDSLTSEDEQVLRSLLF